MCRFPSEEMISGFDDPRFGEGAPLGELAKAPNPHLGSLTGEWRVSAPLTIAACARSLLKWSHRETTPARVFLVPGRLEVLGKHTDYAGGRSLLAAVERGFCFVAVRRPDPAIHVSALNLGAEREFPFSSELVPSPDWAIYPMTVTRRIARDFPRLGGGVDIVFGGNLPPAAGMSSSSAVVVGVFLAIAAATDLLREPRFRGEVRDIEELASYLAAVESGQGFGGLAGDTGVGTHGGSEDHTAILLARENTLLQYRFVPAVLERTVGLPPDYRFVIAASGVQAEKTGTSRDSYNRASALARVLRDLPARFRGGPTGSLAEALRSSPGSADHLRRLARTAEGLEFPAEDLVARLDHFVRESEEIVPAAASALTEHRLDRFGALVDESQRLAERLLGNQIPETIELARTARRLGAAAASAFGAGYGGSVWALIKAAQCEEFTREWRLSYETAFPHVAGRTDFFTSPAGPAARRVV